MFAPVIQGNADLGPRLSEGEVQNALDYCAGLFQPVNHEGANKLREDLEGHNDPLLLVAVKEIQNIAKNPSLFPAPESGSVQGSAAEMDVEMQGILEQVNAGRFIHRDHIGLHSLEEETLGAGYRIRLECGRLGLMQGKAVDEA